MLATYAAALAALLATAVNLPIRLNAGYMATLKHPIVWGALLFGSAYAVTQRADRAAIVLLVHLALNSGMQSEEKEPSPPEQRPIPECQERGAGLFPRPASSRL